MIISIVVPIYNAELYLDECIKSVIDQTLPNWELILVNDGSTDESENICKKYTDADSRIKYFSKNNEGQFLTRRYGVEKASGEYIGFLDADDLLDIRYIEVLSLYIEKFGLIDIFCFGFSRFNEYSKKEYLFDIDEKVQLYNKSNLKNFYKDVICGNISGSMCSKLFLSSKIKSIDVSSKEAAISRYGEDSYYTFSLMAELNSLALINMPLYCYRYNDEGASEGFDKRNFEYYNTKYVSSALLKNLELWGIDDTEHRNLLSASDFNSTVFYILKFFRSAKNIKRKIDIIKFDWSTYLLDYTKETYINNPYVQQSYIKVWKAFEGRKYVEIFLKETTKKVFGIGW